MVGVRLLPPGPVPEMLTVYLAVAGIVPPGPGVKSKPVVNEKIVENVFDTVNVRTSRRVDGWVTDAHCPSCKGPV